MGKLVHSLVIIGSLWTKWVLIASAPPSPPVSPPPGADVSVSCSVDLKPGASAVNTAVRDNCRLQHSDHCRPFKHGAITAV